MKKNIFIDGETGTTGLQVHEKLTKHPNVNILSVNQDKRKDLDYKKEMFEASDVSFLCLPDDGAIEAVEIANDTEYGLAGYIQGEPNHAHEVAKKIRAGQIIINGGARGTGAPFGGYKASGNGREHGLHGLEECLETKAVIAPDA